MHCLNGRFADRIADTHHESRFHDEQPDQFAAGALIDVAYGGLADFDGFTYLKLFPPGNWFDLIVRCGKLPTVAELRSAGPFASSDQLCGLVITEVADMVCSVAEASKHCAWSEIQRDLLELSLLPQMRLGVKPLLTRSAMLKGVSELGTSSRFDDGVDEGFCYLRLFEPVIRNEIRSKLGRMPTWSEILTCTGWRRPEELDMLGFVSGEAGWHVYYRGLPGGFVAMAAAINECASAKVGTDGSDEYHWHADYNALKLSTRVPPRYVVIAPSSFEQFGTLRDRQEVEMVAASRGAATVLSGKAEAGEFLVLPPMVGVRQLIPVNRPTVVRLPAWYQISLYSFAPGTFKVRKFFSEVPRHCGASMASRFFRANCAISSDTCCEMDVPSGRLVTDEITDPLDRDACKQVRHTSCIEPCGYTKIVVESGVTDNVVLGRLLSDDHTATLYAADFKIGVLDRCRAREPCQDPLAWCGVRVRGSGIVVVHGKPGSRFSFHVLTVVDPYGFDGGGLSPGRSDFSGYASDGYC